MQPCDSFFNFFSPPELPGDDAELDEEEEENLHSLLEECTSLPRAITSRQSSHACAVAVSIEAVPCWRTDRNDRRQTWPIGRSPPNRTRRADYELGKALQEKVVPNAVKWYTGEDVE